MEKKNNKVYIARFCGSEVDALMETMEGKVVPICVENEGGSNYLSSVEVRPDYDGLGSEAAKMAARKNAMETMANHAFFFYGDSLDEVGESLSVLAKEPKDMEGFLRSERGVEGIEDCFADGRDRILIVESDEDTIGEMCSSGLIGTGSCEYGPDYEKRELSEMIIGDKAIRLLLTGGKGKVIAFDSPEVVYDNVFGSDFYSLFSRAKRRSLHRDDYSDDYGDDHGSGYGSDMDDDYYY